MVTRVGKITLCLLVLFITLDSSVIAQSSVGTVHLTTGWATFGHTIPQGVAHRGLQVGTLPTQTDVKSRWPDGSIRFAVLTVKVPAPASYAITPNEISSGAFTPALPGASVTLTISRVMYVATLPSTTADEWLSGPLVEERRSTVAPLSADGGAHPFLRVNFDTRVYNDGQARVDVSLENILDVAAARTTTYDASIVINGTEVFRRLAVQHQHLTRWRAVFDVGSNARAAIAPDIGVLTASRALPAYVSSIRDVVDTSPNPRYDIPGPLPASTARYLVHRHPRQRAFVLAQGDLSGSWPVHLRDAQNNISAVGSRRIPDAAAQPSLAFVPYLLTGDRYYAEEMAFWATSGSAPAVNGDGDAWALRNLADAAAYLPDSFPLKASLAEKVAHTLASHDAREKPLDGVAVTPEQNALAYAIDRANKLGFAGGLALRDAIASAQLRRSTRDHIYPTVHSAAAARLSLLVAIENGWEGASAAASGINIDRVPEYAGWALELATPEAAATSADHTLHSGAAAATGDLGVAVEAATALPHNIPDFGNDPSRATVRSVQSGRWATASTWSSGQVPGSNEVVHVDPGHVVTIDTTTAVGYTVQVHGTLRFSPTVNTRLTVTNLMVMGDHGMPSMTTVGYLEAGTAATPIAANVTAEIIIANTPIGNSVSDPEQFGTGFLNFGKLAMHGAPMRPAWTRVAAEPRAGHTTLTLSEPVSGWKAGDRVVIPDTRHMAFNETNGWVNIQNQWEELTIQSVSADGRTISLAAPLQFNHLGARDQNGVLEYLPHVGNLTRNVVVRSQSATGTRGHFIAVHIADTDVRYALFRDLGRTKFTPLNTTTNAIGRYPIHMHHNRGPQPTPANGYQFTLVGNAVDGGSAATQFKWGIAVHNSHFGLIQDNVVYNYNGASIATEDGSESFNVFDHNFAIRGMGEPDDSVSLARTAMGTEGVGFWFRGPNNYVINNVAANFQNPTTEASYGFAYQFRQLGNINVPNFKGADTAAAGQYTSRNGNNMPLLQFENNEAYGAMQGALTFWWVNSLDPQPYANAQETIIKDFRAWHTYNKTVYVYPSAKVTFDGLIIRNAHSSNAHCCGNGVHFNDYSMTAIVIRNSDIQGSNSGIDAPASGFGPAPNLLVENSFFRNWSNIGVPTPSSVNGCWMDNKLIVVRNSVFQAPPGRSLSAIGMGRAVSGAIECLSKLDEVRVYAYQGNANDNFQVYHSNTSVQPRPPASCSPTSKPGISGPTCPIAPVGTPAPTVSLNASPSAITAGGSSTLTWSSTNATSVSINQGIGTVPTSGSRTVSPAATTTYTITATNSSGSVTGSVTISVAANDTTAPVISGVTASNITTTGATITFTTNEGARDSVEYGTTTAYGSVTPTDTTLASSHTVALSGLTAATLYHFRVRATDAAGNAAVSGDFTFTTASAPGGGGTPARSIGIDFAGNSTTAMSATENAGVVIADSWNNATGATRSTPLALVDDAGAATGATVVWTADNVWNTPVADQGGNNRMMRGYLDTGMGGATTVTVAGLPTATYDVYVYFDGDNGSGSRTGAYRISGAGITTTTISGTDAANTNFTSVFTQANNSAGNFVKFTITAGGFTLTATPGAASDAKPRAPVNGIQIVAAGASEPPPPPPPAPDFTIAVSPASQSVAQGTSATYTVTVGAQNGFSNTVNLSVSGTPGGATAAFSPASITGAGTSTLTLTTSATTPAGTSTLTITGTSGTLTHSTTAQLAVSGGGGGRAISVNFINDASDSMPAGEVAGVVAKPNWNNASGADRTTALALNDEAGAASGASITWSSDNVWETPITEQAGNRRMMKGYLDTGFGAATTITVSGLAQGTYDVYVYADGDNGTGSRTGVYRVSAGGVTTTINLTDAANTNFNTAFVQANNSAGNYVRFTITGTGFTLTATPGTSSDGRLRAPVNGLQLVPR